MKISIVVAACLNNCIGKDGDLMWRLNNDMEWFKAITDGTT